MIIADVLERNALHFGDREGVVFKDRRYTHRQHLERVYRLANALIERGVRHQDRVAVLARNCVEYLEAFGAAEAAGFIVVNMNSRLTALELTQIAQDAAPSVLIYTEEFAEVAESLLQATPSITHSMMVGAGRPARAETEVYEAVLAAASSEQPAMRARPEDVVYLIYTTGTTGKPKGVMLDHIAILDGGATLCRECGVLSSDRAVITMPLFHSGALMARITFNLSGALIVLHEGFDLARTLESMHRERATATNLAPVMLQQILDAPGLDQYDLSALRIVMYGSAPMPSALLARGVRRFGAIFNQVYAMTECVTGTLLPACDHNPDGDERAVRLLSSGGRASPGTEIRIVDDDGNPCPAGQPGEILIRNKSIMRGYWNNHTASVEALRDGWMHTQDVGYFDDHGYLYVVDRKRYMIISGGENIYSLEVEDALATHPAVKEAAVIGIPDEKWGESVMAFIVLEPGMQASAEALIAHCKSRIASYKKPRFVEFVDSLPRLFNGKIDKKALRAPYWKSQSRQVA